MAERIVAAKILPEDVRENYQVDGRDDYDADTRYEALARLEERFHIQNNAGGPEAVESGEGYAWYDYPAGRKGAALRAEHSRELRVYKGRFLEGFACFFGPRGSGKTLIYVAVCGVLRGAGYEIVSNIGFDFGRRLSGAAGFAHIGQSPKHTLWGMDEIHDLLNKWRQQAGFAIRMGSGFAGLRKQEAGVGGMSSQPWSIGMNVKSELDWVIYPQKTVRPMLDGRPVNTTGVKRMRLPQRRPNQWATAWGYILGPRPWRPRDDLADMYGIPTGVPPATDRIWLPSVSRLKWAGKLYSSWAGIPTRAQTGAAVKAADVASLDDESTWDFGEAEADGGGAGNGAAMSQEEAWGVFIGLAGKVLDDGAVKPAKSSGLVGTGELIDAVNAAFDEMQFDDATGRAALAEFCGAQRGRVNPQVVKYMAGLTPHASNGSSPY